MLKLGYNDIALKAASSSCDSENTDYPHQNLFYGGSSIFWESDGAETTVTFQLNLPSGGSRGIEYLFLRGLNLITSQANCDITVRGSTDNFVSSNDVILSDTGITSADLIGPHNEDYIITGALSSSYRYYRIVITAASSITMRLRKLFIGQFYTFNNRSPIYPYSSNYNRSGAGFNSDSGAIFNTSRGRLRKEYQFNWTTITDALRDDFDENIGRFLEDCPVFLYKAAELTHEPLNGFTAIMGWANVVHTTGRWKNLNRISLNLIEDLIG
jgi:hypothetical protein